LEQAVRAQVAGLDPLLALSKVRTVDDLMAQSVAEPRFRSTLLGIFAGAALLLAAVGIYGVLSYTVGQRTQEIGIRMTLGARRRDVLALVLGQALIHAGLGVAIGLAAALGLSGVLTRLLFGVSPTDPTTFIAVPLAMTAAALLASYLPARRAARVDPMIALRVE
jgi:putative ABC transport system permease protein